MWKRRLQHVVDLLREDEFHLGANRIGQFSQVLLILLRKDHALESGAPRCA